VPSLELTDVVNTSGSPEERSAQANLACVTPVTYGETDRRCNSLTISAVPPCPDARALREQARDRNVSTNEIAKNLGRTVAAVRAEAQRKNISLKPKNR